MHCPEYEHLTMEEKLLVDIEVKKWFKSTKLGHYVPSTKMENYVPKFIFKEAENRIIEKMREENGKRNGR